MVRTFEMNSGNATQLGQQPILSSSPHERDGWYGG
jgi:hypothetical protein